MKLHGIKWNHQDLNSTLYILNWLGNTPVFMIQLCQMITKHKS